MILHQDTTPSVWRMTVMSLGDQMNWTQAFENRETQQLMYLNIFKKKQNNEKSGYRQSVSVDLA